MISAWPAINKTEHCRSFITTATVRGSPYENICVVQKIILRVSYHVLQLPSEPNVLGFPLMSLLGITPRATGTSLFHFRDVPCKLGDIMQSPPYHHQYASASSARASDLGPYALHERTVCH